MREQIIVDNIAIDNELIIHENHINAYVGVWFDVDKRLGIKTHDTDDYIDLYADYYPAEDRLEASYTVVHGNGSYTNQIPVELTDSEKEAILTEMKKVGLDECIVEMSEDQDVSLAMS